MQSMEVTSYSITTVPSCSAGSHQPLKDSRAITFWTASKVKEYIPTILIDRFKKDCGPKLDDLHLLLRFKGLARSQA